MCSLIKYVRIPQTILDQLRKDEIDLIGLGAGVGDKECQIINSFMNYRNDSSFSYYPVDHSVFMLGEAIKYAIEARRDKYFQIMPILANFKNVNRLINVIKSPKNPRILTMLGGILGNYPEYMILNNIRGFMRENDYLIIDAEFHTDKPDSELIKGYDNDVGREFIAGPIEDIGEYYVNDGTVELRIGEISLRGNLNEIRRRIKYDVDTTASSVSNSRTVIGRLDQGQGFEITLFSATKYDKIEFEKFLEQMKFKIVKPFVPHDNELESANLSPYALYILQA